jgi:hypothetical protein
LVKACYFKSRCVTYSRQGGSCPTGLSTECRAFNTTLPVDPPRVDPLTDPDSQVESSVKLTQQGHSLVTIEPSLSNHSHGSLCPQVGISSSPPGYRELDDEETSLTTVLDSLLPFIRDQDSTVSASPFILVNLS